jgi:hypothetical protein
MPEDGMAVKEGYIEQGVWGIHDTSQVEYEVDGEYWVSPLRFDSRHPFVW